MDVINEMLEDLAASDLIALGALGISVLSLLITLVATSLARESVRDAKAAADEAKAVNAERERAALLVALSNDALSLEETRIAIEALQVEYDAKPEFIRSLLTNYTGLFGQYLDGVKKAVADTHALYETIKTWGPGAGEVDFLKAKTEHHRYSRDHAIVAAQADKLITIFRDRMEHAAQIGRRAP